ncbi:hypothetical protein, partial [Cupriavidus sp. 8B]
SVKGLQLGGASRVNEVRINPMLNFEQILWNSPSTSPMLKSDACLRDYARLSSASAPPSAVQRTRTWAGLHDAAEVA